MILLVRYYVIYGVHRAEVAIQTEDTQHKLPDTPEYANG
jgi:hypothetical protein